MRTRDGSPSIIPSSLLHSPSILTLCWPIIIKWWNSMNATCYFLCVNFLFFPFPSFSCCHTHCGVRHYWSVHLIPHKTQTISRSLFKYQQDLIYCRPSSFLWFLDGSLWSRFQTHKYLYLIADEGKIKLSVSTVKRALKILGPHSGLWWWIRVYGQT